MTETKRMPFEELKKLREFSRLTPKQQFFVETYVTAGMIDGQYNAVTATITAFKCKNEEVARIMSYGLLRNIKIVEVLNRHFGAEPIDEFLDALDRAIRNKDLTLAQLGALRLKCEVMGYGTRIPANINHGGLIQPVQPKADKKPKKTPKTPKAPSAPNLPTYDPSQFE